jgi:hypothetical protein
MAESMTRNENMLKYEETVAKKLRKRKLWRREAAT